MTDAEIQSHLESMAGVDLKSALANAEAKPDQFQQNHLGRFTASENYKLMGGVVSTLEEWTKVLASRRYLKDDLLEMAAFLKEDGVIHQDFTKRDKNEDIAKAVAPFIPIKHDWDDAATTHICSKARERLTDESESADIEHLRHIQWSRENEVEGIMRLKEATGLPIASNFGDDQVFHEFTHQDRVIGGATPDADAADFFAGFEIKCPDTKKHNLLRLGEWTVIDGKWKRERPALMPKNMKELEPEWYWQIVTGFACTDFTSWYWGTYDPRVPEFENQLYWFGVNRRDLEQDIKLLEKRMIEADVLCGQMVELMKVVTTDQ